jgi:hypothetical protein
MHYNGHRESIYVMNVFGEGGGFAHKGAPRLSILLDCAKDVW